MMRALVVSFILLVLTATQAVAEKRIALVIGNSAYQHVGQLSNPVNDAKLMAEVLRQQYFEVIEGQDLTQKQMKTAIRDYSEKLANAGRDTVGFVFYAGHGVQLGGINYLVPVDANIHREGDVDIEAVSANSLLSVLAQTGNRLNVVVFDACRNNPYRSLFRSATRGLAQMSAPTGTLIGFSTAPGEVALDGESTNSPYSLTLAKELVRPGQRVEDVFKETRRVVYDLTNRQQVPWESSSIIGNFYPAGEDMSSSQSTEVAALKAKMAALETKLLRQQHATSVPPLPNIEDKTAEIAPRYVPKDRNSIAILIGNRDYLNTFKVEYALNDVKAMKAFLIKKLGYDPANIEVLENATLGEMRAWLGGDVRNSKLWNRVIPGRSNVFVYYSGHGAPVSDGDASDPYLIPTDVDPEFAADGFSLKQLFQRLMQIKQRIGVKQQVVLMLDTSFSGDVANTAIIGASDLETRPIFNTSNSDPFMPRTPNAEPGIVWMAATTARQVARWDNKTKHGLFTSTFLEGAEGAADKGPSGNGDGVVSWEEMSIYLTYAVNYASRNQPGRPEQTPQFSVEPADWRIPTSRLILPDAAAYNAKPR